MTIHLSTSTIILAIFPGLTLFFLLISLIKDPFYKITGRYLAGVCAIFGVVLLILGPSMHAQSIKDHRQYHQIEHQKDQVAAKYQHALNMMKQHANDQKAYNYWNAEAQILKLRVQKLTDQVSDYQY